jgi:putative intracellular protease/amidase
MPWRSAWLVVVLGCLLFGCAAGEARIGAPKVAASKAYARHGDKKIAIVVSNHGKFGPADARDREDTGYWLAEVTHFYHVVAQHGFAVDFVSPRGGAAALDPDSYDLDDDINRAFVADKKLWRSLRSTRAAKDADPADYAVVYFAGGHGTMWDFPKSAALAELTRKVYEGGAVVAAVCHGVAALLEVKRRDGKRLIAGRRVTGFGNFEENLAGHTSDVPFLLADALEARGARYEGNVFPFTSYVVVDGRLVTGQNPASTSDVAEAVIELLETLPKAKTKRAPQPVSPLAKRGGSEG